MNPTIMDPRHLRQDELEYELEIRRIPVADEDRFQQLADKLQAEETGEVEIPGEEYRTTRQTVSHDLRELEFKLRNIADEFNVACDAQNVELIVVNISRICHLMSRSHRLKAAAPTHFGVDRLLEKVKDLEKQAIANTSSKNSSPQNKSNNSDTVVLVDKIDNNKKTESRGAIPKRFLPPLTSVQNTHQQSDPWPLKEPVYPAKLVSSSPTFSRAENYDYRPQRYAEKNEAYSYTKFHNKKEPANILIPRPQYERYLRTNTSNSQQNADIGNSSHRSAVPSTHSAAAIRQQQPVQQNQQVLSGGHRIRQWNLRFSGSPTGLGIDDFLFRVERQAQLDGVSNTALALGIGDLLTDRAAQWFWTYQRKNERLTWVDLRDAFIRRYASQRDTDYEIRAKIETRKQRVGEHFGDFCQDIEALAVRLTRRMPEDELIEVLRRNMNMRLRKALWQSRSDTVEELINDCEEYERLCEEEDRQHQLLQRRSMRVSELEEPQPIHYHSNQNHQQDSDPEFPVEALDTTHMICWNCKDIGHVFTQCRQPRQSIFCFSCGSGGVLRNQCTNVRCLGNAKKDAPITGLTRSNPTAILNSQNQQTTRINPTEPHLAKNDQNYQPTRQNTTTQHVMNWQNQQKFNPFNYPPPRY